MSVANSKNSSSNFTLYPLLWLAICFALGILAAHFFVINWKILLAGCLVFATLTAVFQTRKFALMFLSIAFVAVGGLCLSVENNLVAPNRLKRLYDTNQIKSGDPIEIEGVLRGKPELAVGGFFLILKTEKAIYKDSEIKATGNVRLFAPVREEQIEQEYEQLNLNYGSRIRVACQLRREDNFLNAGVISHKELLDQRQIDAVAVIKSSLLVEKIADTKTFAPLAWIYERRQNLIVDFRDKFNISTAGVLIASLLGNQHFLDKNTAEVFRAGGTFHVLVISGLHITFIGGLTLLFIRFFTNKRLSQFIIASLFLWSYSIAVGADVPVVRATIMFTILLFSQVIYRSGTLLNAFGFCALILLVWRPNDIFTSSFQLTFVSVGAIVAIAFPLIENLRAIGTWSPSAETPFPPNVSKRLRRFCETLYWRDEVWKIENKRNLWTAKLFKLPHLKWTEKRNLQNPLRYIFEAILVSLIVQMCLLPLLVIYFHRVSFASIFLNLWVGITISLESFAAVVAVFFAQISDVAAFPFIRLTEFFNWLMLSIPQILSANDWASVRVPHYAGAMKAVYLLYFAPLLFLTILLNQWKPSSLSSEFQVSSFRFLIRVSASFLVVLAALLIFHPFSAPRLDGRLHIDFLDVGQGDAALITFPNGEALLVDGGGKGSFSQIYVQNEYADEPELFEPDTNSVGETIVSAFLWKKGYSQIDYILATHADADHIQGLSDVAKNFKVRTALFGRTPLQNAEFAALFEILQRRDVPIIKISRGDILNFDATRIEVLYPEKDDSPDAVSDNNHSVVLRVIYGERKILLTGDIEKETESNLLNAPEFLQADVVKAAHHGSRTSSTQGFIEATRAKLVVIPVGRESPFGHPHKEVLERWTNSGAKIVTTGMRGTVSISTDGKDLQMKTFLR
ncbi:MAG: ComEC/Rec2 family competence protein [Pyrinomonadaceae bacterium]